MESMGNQLANLQPRSTYRRQWLKRFLLLATGPTLSSLASLPAWAAEADAAYPEVFPRPLVFPRDFGAHPDYRTEWWYMTGWLGEAADRMGFQVTFFRSRTLHPDSNPSRFAPRQLLFAHAALALPAEGQLRHAEVAGRAGPAGAALSASDTGVALAGWSLHRTAEDHYKVSILTDKFTLELVAISTQAPVLRGEGGYSTKGPEARFASYYYSRPQLKVSAQVTLKNSASSRGGVEKPLNLSGSAWFDHEWSSSLLMPGAVGWDWIGINLFDGSNLMAFRMRDAAGAALFSEWDWRDAKGQRIESRQDVRWLPAGQWRSPRSLFSYPERFELSVGDQIWTLRPLMSDQEVDAQTSTGGFYYEGAVELIKNGKLLGSGYLELTGYGTPVPL
jgi:predicted secreted hydrolase